MGFPCPVFHASELPVKVQADLKGKKRKLQGREHNIDLAACDLHEMLQYKCEIKEPEKRESPIQCFAIERLFRRCKDRKGPFMVETTAWEGKNFSEAASAANHDGKERKAQQPYQWASGWQHADAAP